MKRHIPLAPIITLQCIDLLSDIKTPLPIHLDCKCNFKMDRDELSGLHSWRHEPERM